MASAWVPIVVAVIGGPIMWFLSRFDRRNTHQHNQNMGILQRVESKVDHLRDKADHLDSKMLRIDEKVDNVNDRVAKLEAKRSARRTPKTE